MSAADLQEKALNHALHVMFEHCKDPQPLITFGTQLKNQKMYEVLKEVSFAALERINVLEQTRRDRVLRLKEITYLLSKTPLPDQRLNLEKQIYDSLPLYVRHDEHTHHSMNLQVVQLIVAAILDKREDQRVSQLNSSLVRTIDLTVVEEELLQVVKRCVPFVQSPASQLALLNQLSRAALPELVVEVGLASQDTIEALRAAHQERVNMLSELKVLQDESERLKKIKKTLPDQQQSRLVSLRQANTNLENNPPPIYDKQNFDRYDEETFELVKHILVTLFDARDSLAEKIRLHKKLTKSEEVAVKTKYNDLIEKVISWALAPKRVENPTFMIKLAEILNDRKQFSSVLEVAKKVRQRIKELEILKAERQALGQALATLQKEREELFKNWKLMEIEKWHELWQLEMQHHVLARFPAYYSDSFNYLYLNTSKLMLKAVVDMKQDKIGTIKFIDDQIDAIMAEVEDPAQLCELARHIEKRNESDIVLKFGEKCQRKIKEVEDLRQTRAPLHRELMDLETEQAALATEKKVLAPSKQARMAELREQLAQLPTWPEYANLLNDHQYDNLNLDIVRVMTSAILDNKTALEQRISKMFLTQDPKTIDRKKIEDDRQAIKQRINSMVKLCLEKFENPAFLLKFAKDMQSRNEAEIVVQIVDKGLVRINEIDLERQKRYPLIKEAKDLKEEERKLYAISKKKLDDEKQKRLKELEDQIAAWPVWPHFAKIEKAHQYDKTRLALLLAAFDASLDARLAVEKAILSEKFEVTKAMARTDKGDKTDIEAKHKSEKEKTQGWLDHVVQQVIDNLSDPEHLKSFLKQAKQRNEIEVVLTIGVTCYKKIQSLEELREKRDKIVEHIELINQERNELAARKKTLDAEQQENLTRLEKKLNDMMPLPQFLSTADEHLALNQEVTTLIIEATLNRVADIQKTMQQEDVNVKELEVLRDQKQNLMERTIKLCLEHMSDPNALLWLLRRLKDAKEFDAAIEVGEKCRATLADLAKYRLSTLQMKKQKEQLLEQKEFLDRQRKSLPAAQMKELREVQLAHRLHVLKPSFFGDSMDYSALDLSLTNTMIDTAVEKRTQWENSIAMNDEISPEDIEEEKKNLADLTVSIIYKSLRNITDIPVLIQLAKDMKNRRLFDLVIIVGDHCENQISLLRKEIEDREEMQAQHKELEQQILLFSIASADSRPKEKREVLEQRLQESKARLDSLPPLAMDRSDLNRSTLEITDLMIDAAKIENLDDVLREQTILAFKTDVKAERWDRVRDLCGEDEWAKIKQELVVYVLKQEDANANDKIELLMKDGLWAQCVTIFPAPTGEASEIELLEKLWTQVERHEPTVLDQLLQVVSRYMKRFYQEFRHEEMDSLLDRVQVHFPAIMKALLAAAADLMLLNILPSQYSLFISCLKNFKKRLTGALNRPADWDEFFTEFKKKHRGKKKLIQMAALIGDSSWDLTAMMMKRKAKREKPESEEEEDEEKEEKKKATPTRLKRRKKGGY